MLTFREILLALAIVVVLTAFVIDRQILQAVLEMSGARW